MEPKPGTQTSSFKLTAIVAILGAILAGLTTTFAALKESFPDAAWVGVILGALMAIAPVVAYVSGRTKVDAAHVLVQGLVAQANSITNKTFTSATTDVITNPNTPVAPPFQTPRSGP